MRTAHGGEELGSLDRLRAEEASLDLRLDEARRVAARVAAEADRQVKVVRDDAAQRLAHELARLEASAAAERDAAIAAVRDETARGLEGLRARAAERAAEAVALVRAALAGEGPP